jgi:hypothetical protein
LLALKFNASSSRPVLSGCLPKNPDLVPSNDDCGMFCSDFERPIYFFPRMPITFSISAESKARLVVVWTVPCDDRFSMAAVAVSSSGASKISGQHGGQQSEESSEGVH